ncbi:MAG: hypothetical protein Q4G71_14985 [Pseudomonadota bacterium]|nr:hypothetical protein [Pseudomonadota bacterium]
MAQARSLSARERFRQHGRQVLRVPADAAAHEARVMAACALPGTEPVQGALADMLHACQPDAAFTQLMQRLLRRPAVAERLAPFVVRAFAALADRGQRLPRVTPLATRFCVLAMPSLDVPRRALLVGVDDARAIAALLAGDAAAEDAFLAHCEGAGDALAFMLVRRALAREGRALPARWDAVSAVLQNGVQPGEKNT